MTTPTRHVMVSYKREDELRVSKLVFALQRTGLNVWWDQALPGGESWRQNITTAVEAAGCVVVVWSHGSVGPEGGFVRDEAGHAKARGVLVPILIDTVDPPLGFGELQAIDLRHWKGNPKDPFFADLVAACRAKLEGGPAPAGKGPASRLFRRARAGSLAAAATAMLWTFAANFHTVQNRVCTIPLAQPSISDVCGSMGLGERPSKAERLDWEARRKGSCDDLRSHVARFPNGVYSAKAAELIAAAITERASTYSSDPRTVRGYVRQSERPFGSTSAAQADAKTRAQTDALSLCAPLDASERLDGVAVKPVAFDCRTGLAGGQVCALDYTAICRTEQRVMTERCG
jgi:hypothetical protein